MTVDQPQPDTENKTRETEVKATATDPFNTSDVEVKADRSLSVSNDNIGGRLKQFFPQ